MHEELSEGAGGCADLGTVGPARQDDRDARPEDEPGGFRAGEMDQLLGQHVAGDEVRCNQNVGVPRHRPAEPLIKKPFGSRGLPRDRGVEGKRPSTQPPVIWPRTAILHRATASRVEPSFVATVSTAERIAAFGTAIPSVRQRLIAFCVMSRFSSSVGRCSPPRRRGTGACGNVARRGRRRASSAAPCAGPSPWQARPTGSRRYGAHPSSGPQPHPFGQASRPARLRRDCGGRRRWRPRRGTRLRPSPPP